MTWAFAVPPGLMIALGIWRVTAADPKLDVDGASSARSIGRKSGTAAVVLALLTGPVYMLVYATSTGRSPTIDYEAAAAGLLMFAGCRLLMVFGFAAIVRGADIADRAGNVSLTAAVRTLGITWGVTLASLVAVFVVGAALGGMGVCLVLPALLAGAACGLYSAVQTVVLTIRFRMLFARYLTAER